MDNSELYEKYKRQYLSLKSIVQESQDRVVCDIPDDLFLDNMNFFVKSYLINICTYLEAYLQDIANWYVTEIKVRIQDAKIPNNIILWRIKKEVKKNELTFTEFDLKLTKEDISDNLSPNPWRTTKLFKYLGINLSRSSEFEDNKILVSTVVEKRNSIIHHNDTAADISFLDILEYIEIFLSYIKGIDTIVYQEETL